MLLPPPLVGARGRNVPTQPHSPLPHSILFYFFPSVIFINFVAGSRNRAPRYRPHKTFWFTSFLSFSTRLRQHVQARDPQVLDCLRNQRDFQLVQSQSGCQANGCQLTGRLAGATERCGCEPVVERFVEYCTATLGRVGWIRVLLASTVLIAAWGVRGQCIFSPNLFWRS